MAVSKKVPVPTAVGNIDDLLDFNTDIDADDIEITSLPIKGNLNETRPNNVAGVELVRVPVEYVRPNPYQYRQEITPESVEELVNEFQQRGIDNALHSIPKATPRNREGRTVYILAFGHRRWRAWQLAFPGQPFPLAVDYNLSDFDLAVVAVSENLNRQDPSDVEFARGLQSLLDINPKLTLGDLSRMFGKSSSNLNRKLQLLNLPGNVQNKIVTGQLSAAMGAALTRFTGVKGGVEFVEELAEARHLTAEDVQKQGWELLRDWPGWVSQPMPPEARQVLGVRPATPGVLPPVETPVVINDLPDVNGRELDNVLLERIENTEIYVKEPPVSVQSEDLNELDITDTYDFSASQSTAGISPFPTPHSASVRTITGRTSNPPETQGRSAEKLNNIEGFLKRLQQLQKSGEVSTDPAILLALQMAVGVLIGNTEQSVVERVIGSRWHWLSQGSATRPTISELEKSWMWVRHLDLGTLAMLAGELVYEQWKWEERYFNRVTDTNEWLIRQLETLT